MYASVHTYQNLIEEVLNELFLERSGSEQTVEIGSEQLCDEVASQSQPGNYQMQF